MTMKKGLTISLLIFSLIVSLFAPVGSADAKQVKKAKVSTHYYKKKKTFKYAQVKNLSKAHMKTINRDLKDDIAFSYSTYLFLKDEAKKEGIGKITYERSFKTKFNNGKKLSILNYDYMNDGSMHGDTMVTSMNYVLIKKKTKQLYFTDVVKTKKKRTKVRDYIYNYTKKHKSKFYANLKKSDIQIGYDTQYYFTKKGIAVVFQPYEISPYYVGIPMIQVPAKVYK
ncbi:DUF3298 and DUF4163 domain-containing protein [Bacillus altitudinis]|uniref:DUF3298 and DUF4163 domain-containing protein n=1 Tax=Bacillus altitudinis TaxID=293387 RepID=UPI0022832618|nr:DUF3298 and DUF4163 domain-containing protein [Bacillus altitudinis]MCY7437881.1 DUF3298 and DUF4163 domain-containing protein [Bacillus altitudinis]MEC1142681.1 DUF3298 domain-containing protein [Bacillus altitudinis]